MDLFGIDIVSVLLTAGFVSFWGAVFIGFIIFYDKNPYVPRKYWKVKIENKSGGFLRYTKGWIVKSKKVPYFRIGLKGLPAFKGIEIDISKMEAIDSEGILTIIENVPEKYDETNYRIKEIPLTQRESFENEVIENVVKPLCIMEYEEEGEKKRGYNENMVEHYTLKIKDALNKNSRIEDMNSSAATRRMLEQARREGQRASSDDFITKYAPTIILIFVCLFAYLILDSATKAYQVTMAQSNQVQQNGFSQIIQQCGGVFVPVQEPNVTQQQGNSGVQIPFITS